ncbi:DUF302 domain-containing protein [Flavilitoribacter nigricans]|nr:DUF302 domain-containing protein [Flavilitoribacter nigricans]
MNYLSVIGCMLFAALFFQTCDDVPHPTQPETALIKVENEASVADVYAAVKANIEGKGLNVVAEVNHGQAAANVGINLRPTRLIIFGNPEVGTKLMQAEQRIGIDLPLKMLVYEAVDGETITAYYNGSYLADNYNIDDLEAVEDGIDGALAMISGNDSEGPDVYVGQKKINSLQTVESSSGVEATYTKVKQAVLDRSFSVIAEVDHSAAAANVGLELRPTRLIIFGKPEGGSLLMQSNQEIGIELPLKILVWEDAAGNTQMGYYTGTYLAKRYDIKDQDNVVENIDNALSAITAEAAGE